MTLKTRNSNLYEVGDKIRFTYQDKKYVGYIRKPMFAVMNFLIVVAEKAEKFVNKKGVESLIDKNFNLDEVHDIVKLTDKEYELNKIKV